MEPNPPPSSVPPSPSSSPSPPASPSPPSPPPITLALELIKQMESSSPASPQLLNQLEQLKLEEITDKKDFQVVFNCFLQALKQQLLPSKSPLTPQVISGCVAFSMPEALQGLSQHVGKMQSLCPSLHPVRDALIRKDFASAKKWFQTPLHGDASHLLRLAYPLQAPLKLIQLFAEECSTEDLAHLAQLTEENQQASVAKLLLELELKGKEPLSPSALLSSAVSRGWTCLTQHLIDQASPPFSSATLFQSCQESYRNGDLDMAQLLWSAYTQDSPPLPPLHKAAQLYEKGMPGLAQSLLENQDRRALLQSTFPYFTQPGTALSFFLDLTAPLFPHPSREVIQLALAKGDWRLVAALADKKEYHPLFQYADPHASKLSFPPFLQALERFFRTPHIDDLIASFHRSSLHLNTPFYYKENALTTPLDYFHLLLEKRPLGSASSTKAFVHLITLIEGTLPNPSCGYLTPKAYVHSLRLRNRKSTLERFLKQRHASIHPQTQALKNNNNLPEKTQEEVELNQWITEGKVRPLLDRLNQSPKLCAALFWTPHQRPIGEPLIGHQLLLSPLLQKDPDFHLLVTQLAKLSFPLDQLSLFNKKITSLLTQNFLSSSPEEFPSLQKVLAALTSSPLAHKRFFPSAHGNSSLDRLQKLNQWKEMKAWISDYKWVPPHFLQKQIPLLKENAHWKSCIQIALPFCSPHSSFEFLSTLFSLEPNADIDWLSSALQTQAISFWETAIERECDHEEGGIYTIKAPLIFHLLDSLTSLSSSSESFWKALLLDSPLELRSQPTIVDDAGAPGSLGDLNELGYFRDLLQGILVLGPKEWIPLANKKESWQEKDLLYALNPETHSRLPPLENVRAVIKTLPCCSPSLTWMLAKWAEAMDLPHGERDLLLKQALVKIPFPFEAIQVESLEELEELFYPFLDGDDALCFLGNLPQKEPSLWEAPFTACFPSPSKGWTLSPQQDEDGTWEHQLTAPNSTLCFSLPPQWLQAVFSICKFDTLPCSLPMRVSLSPPQLSHDEPPLSAALTLNPQTLQLTYTAFSFSSFSTQSQNFPSVFDPKIPKMIEALEEERLQSEATFLSRLTDRLPEALEKGWIQVHSPLIHLRVPHQISSLNPPLHFFSQKQFLPRSIEEIASSLKELQAHNAFLVQKAKEIQECTFSGSLSFELQVSNDPIPKLWMTKPGDSMRYFFSPKRLGWRHRASFFTPLRNGPLFFDSEGSLSLASALPLESLPPFSSLERSFSAAFLPPKEHPLFSLCLGKRPPYPDLSQEPPLSSTLKQLLGKIDWESQMGPQKRLPSPLGGYINREKMVSGLNRLVAHTQSISRLSSPEEQEAARKTRSELLWLFYKLKKATPDQLFSALFSLGDASFFCSTRVAYTLQELLDQHLQTTSLPSTLSPLHHSLLEVWDSYKEQLCHSFTEQLIQLSHNPQKARHQSIHLLSWIKKELAQFIPSPDFSEDPHAFHELIHHLLGEQTALHSMETEGEDEEIHRFTSFISQALSRALFQTTCFSLCEEMEPLLLPNSLDNSKRQLLFQQQLIHHALSLPSSSQQVVDKRSSLKIQPILQKWKELREQTTHQLAQIQEELTLLEQEPPVQTYLQVLTSSTTLLAQENAIEKALLEKSQQLTHPPTEPSSLPPLSPPKLAKRKQQEPVVPAPMELSPSAPNPHLLFLKRALKTLEEDRDALFNQKEALSEHPTVKTYLEKRQQREKRQQELAQTHEENQAQELKEVLEPLLEQAGWIHGVKSEELEETYWLPTPQGMKQLLVGMELIHP